MLQPAFVKENREEAIKLLSRRKLNAAELVDKLIELDDHRKKTQLALDNQLAEINKISKEIGEYFKTGKKDEAEKLKQSIHELKEVAHNQKEKLIEAESALINHLYLIPNIPNPIVPEGKDEADNDIVKTGGQKPSYKFDPKPHWELADKYQLIDFDLGSKITGAGFPVYMGKGARMQRALINFFLDEAIEAGYHEVIPPHLVNEQSATGTGQLPDKEGQMYHTEVDHLYLIPTAEVPITNIYRDVIVRSEDFPLKKVGYTPCFRREAGSYGKDVRGLNRLHQFDKVEIVQITHPQRSYETLDQMVSYVENLLIKLELPYRIARLCAGDLGFTSAITYDMEVFSAAQEKWLEVSSISNFESYQSNRMKIRFKDEEGKIHLAHTLNGSALALPRILASILENNQYEDGIKVPEVLQKYTGFKTIN